MRRLTLAGLTLYLAGGPDREGGGDGPLLLLLHGFGAPGTDLVALHRAIVAPPAVRYAFPAGRLALDDGAAGDMGPRAWWMIDIARLQTAVVSGDALRLAGETPEGLAEARAAVEGLLDALERDHAAPRERIVLGGFSQGGMLACDIALRTERAPLGLVLLSGAPIAEPEWRALAPRRAGLRVLMSHGRTDPILPFAGGEHLRDLLREGGLDVEWHAFSGGHGIPDGVVERLGPFLAEVGALAAPG